MGGDLITIINFITCFHHFIILITVLNNVLCGNFQFSDKMIQLGESSLLCHFNLRIRYVDSVLEKKLDQTPILFEVVNNYKMYVLIYWFLEELEWREPVFFYQNLFFCSLCVLLIGLSNFYQTENYTLLC